MGLIQDLKFSLRTLLKNPGFSLVAILTLALGIGVNSTVFTLTNAVLIKGLPYEKPDEILHISNVNTAQSNSGMGVSYNEFQRFRENRSFSALGAFYSDGMDISDDAAAADRVDGALVSANAFSLLGQKIFRGRDFQSGDDTAGATPVALLSYSLWQNRYGGADSALGRTIKVNQKSYTIVGIMPQGMKFPETQELWLPILPGTDEASRNARNLQVFGRLLPGVSAEQARVEMKTISHRLAQDSPESNKDIESVLMTFNERFNGGQIKTVFLAMQGAVGFVLLIACANMANLLLSRAVGRTRETAIRTALGAGRWRIIRQLLVESILLSFIGGTIGLALSVAGIRVFSNAVENTGKPYWIDFAMDYHVALFFIAICVITGILFGLAPALQMSKTNMNDSLKEGSRGSAGGGMRARRLTSVLLVSEIGLTIVLLVGAGLMIRSFFATQFVNIGFSTDNLLTARVSIPATKYPQPADKVRFENALMEKLHSISGLQILTLASNAPAAGTLRRTLKLEDRNIADANNHLPAVNAIAVAPGYFSELKLAVPRGREFNESDGRPGTEAVIVNDSFARMYWPGDSPIGKRVRLGDKDDAPWLSVIGTSPDIFQASRAPNGDESAYPPLIYIPYRQDPVATFSLLARAHTSTGELTTALRNALHELDEEVPLYNIATTDETLAQRAWQYRVFGSLFTIFALLALLMSSVGIYAVTAYGINQRTQEIGVRIALGARRSQVLWLVLRQGLTRIAAGLGIGLIAAFGVSRVLASVLFRVTPTDPATFVLISLLLATVTLIACIVPALRAMRLDPATALRSE